MATATKANKVKKDIERVAPLYYPCTNDTPLIVQATCTWDYGLEFEGDFLFSRRRNGNPFLDTTDLTVHSADNDRGYVSLDKKPVLIMSGSTYRSVIDSEFDQHDKIVLTTHTDRNLELKYINSNKFQNGINGSDIFGGNSISFHMNALNKYTIFMGIPNGYFNANFVNYGINIMRNFLYEGKNKKFVVYGGKTIYDLYLNEKYLSKPTSDIVTRIALLKVRSNNEVFNIRYNGRATSYFPIETVEKYFKIEEVHDVAKGMEVIVYGRRDLRYV